MFLLAFLKWRRVGIATSRNQEREVMGYKDKDQQRAFQLNWITARKRKYLEQLGCCFFCGSHDNIEIHHVDPETKEHHAIWSWSDDRIENELRKCVALCHECHVKFHLLEKRRNIQHGTCSAYRHGCRCDDCKAAKAKDDHDRKQRKRQTP
jgi:hypothetical protein